MGRASDISNAPVIQFLRLIIFIVVGFCSPTAAGLTTAGILFPAGCRKNLIGGNLWFSPEKSVVGLKPADG
jgi:hypothetical protein